MKCQASQTPLYRTWHGVRPRGYVVAPHLHNEAQLLFAASGALQVYTESGRWLVPPQLAVWIPAGIPHSIEFLSATELWTIYWKSTAVRAWTASKTLHREFALRVTALLRELVFAAFETTAPAEKTRLVAKLILQELIEIPNAPTFLPMPSTLLGRRVADVALADYRLDLNTDMIATRAATSVRTISRLFPLETGLTFRHWRQRARIVLSMDSLARGEQIAEVASQHGFASTAAFSFAFRQITGMTPSAFAAYPGPTQFERSSHASMIHSAVELPVRRLRKR
jgi:AraC-like DNA-binding protein